jgi:uncharacterized protein with PIN domain
MSLMLRERNATDVDVLALDASVPEGPGTTILAAGESHRGIPYMLWAARVGQTVSVSALQAEAQTRQAVQIQQEQAARRPVMHCPSCAGPLELGRVVVTSTMWDMLVARLSLAHLFFLPPQGKRERLLGFLRQADARRCQRCRGVWVQY